MKMKAFENPNPTKRVRYIYVFVGLAVTVLGIVLSLTYRPYVYANNINDFHLADTIGSWVSVPAASLFCYGLSDKKSFLYYVVLTTVIYILWELLGLARIHGTFDYWDILAVSLSGILTYSIYHLLTKK